MVRQLLFVISMNDTDNGMVSTIKICTPHTNYARNSDVGRYGPNEIDLRRAWAYELANDRQIFFNVQE